MAEVTVGTLVRAIGLAEDSVGWLGGEVLTVNPDDGTCLVRMFRLVDGQEQPGTTFRLRSEGLIPVPRSRR